jgi:nitrogen fixation protein NifU and related proteins
MTEAGRAIDTHPGFKYSEILIDHAKNPRNMEGPPPHNGFALNDGFCGDMMMVWINIQGDMVTDIAFSTDGCGPSIACGSMATELTKGKHVAKAKEITPEIIEAELGGLPEDHKHCASLAAGTLQLAITDYFESSCVQ